MLADNNMLFGGYKGKVPKFELIDPFYGGGIGELSFKIKNVSSIMISNLKSINLEAEYGEVKRKVNYNPQFAVRSLKSGENTIVKLNNDVLGDKKDDWYYDYWYNVHLIWYFSCEDEENNRYYYQMDKYICNPGDKIEGDCEVRYLGRNIDDNEFS